jgi:uncharacterized protein (TIGR02452 family)
MNIFIHRMNVWKETEKLSEQFPKPITEKITYDPNQILEKQIPQNIKVINGDSISIGKILKDKGYNPLVLIFADHRFAGGDVKNGCTSQEEELFRRTNLCQGLIQNKYYPILSNEVIVTKGITIFRDLQYNFIENTFCLDFIACPGIHNPRLVDEKFNSEDEEILRTKIRLILQAGMEYNALVLGPLGCGAWRCPPEEVARIFKEELQTNKLIVFACLEVTEHVVVNCERVSNFDVFSRVFNTL